MTDVDLATLSPEEWKDVIKKKGGEKLEADLAVKIVRNAHRKHFLETIRVLNKEIRDYGLFSKIAQILAEKQLLRETTVSIDTEHLP